MDTIEPTGERPTLMVTGATGQVGHELIRALSGLGRVVPTTRAALDLSSATSIQSAVREIKPTFLLNAAAYTAVDRAENEVALAEVLNGTAPGVLAEEVARVGGGIIHFSTDYVFDGESDVPYRESDPTGPVNAYGRTKLMGERAVASGGAPYLILRTGWVYATRGANFLRTVLRLSREREQLRIVDDQRGSPTAASAIADATASLVRVLLAAGGASALRERQGLYHLGAAGVTSWYGFAREILARESDPSGRVARDVVPIFTSEYPTAARRPRYSVLDCGHIRSTFGVAMDDWRVQLAGVLASLPVPAAAR